MLLCYSQPNHFLFILFLRLFTLYGVVSENFIPKTKHQQCACIFSLFFLLFLNKISGCSSSFLWFNGIESGLFKRLRELVYDSAIRYILMPFFVNFGMLWMLQSFNLLNFQVFNCNKTIYFVTDLVFLEAAFFVY